MSSNILIGSIIIDQDFITVEFEFPWIECFYVEGGSMIFAVIFSSSSFPRIKALSNSFIYQLK